MNITKQACKHKRKLNQLMRSLYLLLKKFNFLRHHSNRVASHKTQSNRKGVLEHELRYLFESGYRITNVEQFRTKQLIFLIHLGIYDRHNKLNNNIQVNNFCRRTA